MCDVAVDAADERVQYLNYVMTFGSYCSAQVDAWAVVVRVALYCLVSGDYEYFVYFPVDLGPVSHAIHLNGEYSNGPRANGFASDSNRWPYLSNASNYFALKHFALYFAMTMHVPEPLLMLKTIQLDVQRDRCDEMDDDADSLTANLDAIDQLMMHERLHSLANDSRPNDDAHVMILADVLTIVSNGSWLEMYAMWVAAAAALLLLVVAMVVAVNGFAVL